MPVAEFVFPAVLGRVEREEADGVGGMPADVIGDIGIIDPLVAKLCLAAEDARAGVVLGGGPVGFMGDGQVDGFTGFCGRGLADEILAEAVGKGPGVAVDVEYHFIGWRRSADRTGDPPPPGFPCPGGIRGGRG